MKRYKVIEGYGDTTITTWHMFRWKALWHYNWAIVSQVSLLSLVVYDSHRHELVRVMLT